MAKSGTILAGIGGWTFEPWRGAFYPPKLPQAQELHYASRALTTIEINGTYYRTQTPQTFKKWHQETPSGFVFTVKAPRFATNRRVLAEAGDSISRFFDSGMTQLGDKLGPVFWQFAPTKKFDDADFGAFLDLLPAKVDGREIRHALEVRHPSFATEAFVGLARRQNAAIVYADHAKYPAIADVTSDFVYARLQTGSDDVPTAYTPKALDDWVARAKLWVNGGAPGDLPLSDPSHKLAKKPRDVFVFFIHEGKVRAPHAAMAFIERLGAKK